MNPAEIAETPIRDLVLVHGWGMNAAVWDTLPETFSTGLTRHPVELPGHGESPFGPLCEGGSSALWAWADACLAAAPERAVWLGWSLGGLVAQAAALSAPERIQALVLMTATPRFVRSVDWTPAMPAETLAQFHDGLVADPEGTLSRFLALQVRGSEHARETLRALRHELSERPTPDPRALSLGLELLREEDLRGPLPDLRPPCLWLFGSHDTLVPAAVADRVKTLMPKCRTCVIQGAAHAPFLSHPVETAETVNGFLNGLAAGSSKRGPECD